MIRVMEALRVLSNIE